MATFKGMDMAQAMQVGVLPHVLIRRCFTLHVKAQILKSYFSSLWLNTEKVKGGKAGLISSVLSTTNFLWTALYYFGKALCFVSSTSQRMNIIWRHFGLDVLSREPFMSNDSPYR